MLAFCVSAMCSTSFQVLNSALVFYCLVTNIEHEIIQTAAVYFLKIKSLGSWGLYLGFSKAEIKSLPGWAEIVGAEKVVFKQILIVGRISGLLLF